MKIRVFAIAVAFVAAAQSLSAEASGKMATYANGRFGYVVEYPADFLIPERESDNGDGRAFHARHGVGKMLVWGSYRDEDTSATSLMIARSYETDCAQGKITYEAIKSGLVAFSCIRRTGEIIYQKTLVGHEVLRSVRFEYPYSDKTKWDTVVKQVSASLR